MITAEILDIVDPWQDMSPAEASDIFFAATAPLGVTYLQTRVYRRPTTRLTAKNHWAAGGVVRRVAPESWPGSAAFNYVCFDCNPLLRPIMEGRTRYAFGDFAPHGDPRFGAYWDALGEAGVSEALCATSYGPKGAIASAHIGFSDRDADPARRSVQLAGLLLTEYLLEAAVLADEPDPDPELTARERDCLAFVAEGKTDWEISVILGLAESTVRFHVDNARRKLDAVNRAQAAAKLVLMRLV